MDSTRVTATHRLTVGSRITRTFRSKSDDMTAPRLTVDLPTRIAVLGSSLEVNRHDRPPVVSLVQVKHIDYVNWRITLPWTNAKGGKTTGRDEFVWVMSDRLRRVLEQRRFLGPDAYVFGTEDGRRIDKFHNAWRLLYRTAGLPDNLTWHDARHEFVSSLIEEGGTVQEVKEAARHKSITTTAKYMKASEDRLRALLEKRALRLSRV
jgi:hypothetical protein